MTLSHPVPAGQAVPAMRPESVLHGAELEAAIGRLVREALQHQLGLTAAAASKTAPQVAPSAAPSAAPLAASAGHPIGEAVVSLQVLERLPEGTRRVEIGARAVLTPAAADRLRQEAIEVVRGAASQGNPSAGNLFEGNPSQSQGVSPANVCCWIADAEHPERVSGYVRQLAGRGLSTAGVELPLESVPRLSAAGASEGIGVVIAALPALHVDHFARRHLLPAAAVGSLSEVARIAAAMSPAVWVLDAERLSFSGRVAVAAECIRLSQTPLAERKRPR